jgi:large subunit ribosomal protein L29
MKTKDFRAKAPEELQKDFIAFKKELFNLRFQKVQGAIEKTHRVRQLKRAVAKVSTLLNEIKLGIKLEKKEKKVKALSAPNKVIKADVAPQKLVKSVKPKATKEAEPKVKKQTVKKDKKNA